jgi:hypothetical protein
LLSRICPCAAAGINPRGDFWDLGGLDYWVMLNADIMRVGTLRRLGRFFGDLCSHGIKQAAILGAGVALASCREKKEGQGDQEENREAVTSDRFANMAMDLLAQELFQYEGGFLFGNETPSGF